MSSAVELVVTDLDGTLSDAGERVHPKTIRAVLALGRAGIPVLVATGRRPRTAALVLEGAGLRGRR
jgi:hydroxymethylpyrimidine pyrophosphatase-like HAD family hydrolase